MAIVWPASLPQRQFVGLTEKVTPNTIEQQVSAGPPIVRRRSTRSRREFTTPMVLSGEQVATLKTFFHTTLRDGTKSFEWTDFINGDTVQYRFLGPPAYRLIIGGADPNKRRYDVEIAVEEVFW